MIRKFALGVLLAGVFSAGMTVPAHAEHKTAQSECVSKTQAKKIHNGAHRQRVYKRLGSHGKRVLLFSWQLQSDDNGNAYPETYSDFRTWKMCDGRTLRLSFASPWGDEHHWTVEEKVIR
jgi:hypothetical protein